MQHRVFIEEKWKNLAIQAGFSKAEIVNLTLSKNDKTEFLNHLHQHLNVLDYMQKHVHLRLNPQLLLENAQSVLMVAMPYAENPIKESPISIHAHGRDYHKIIRKRLQKVVDNFKDFLKTESLKTASIAQVADMARFRVFCDSAPVLEKVYAAKSAIGWRGKNSLIINRQGSFFFLGGVLTNLPLASPQNAAHQNHCGTCQKCVDFCPTAAILENGKIEAKRCIAFWLNEHKGAIPFELCEQFGVRIYGCDACQMVCPWNRFAKITDDDVARDFAPREFFNPPNLKTLFLWTKEEFLKNLEGTTIRRIGYESWQRNVSIAIANAVHLKQFQKETAQNLILEKLNIQTNLPEYLKKHFEWALKRIENAKA